jgi:hypothetical protein
MVIAEAVGAEDGACVLSVAALAERAELSRRSVIDHLAALEAAGLIRRSRRTNSFGHRVADDIALAMEPVDQGAGNAPGEAAKVQELHLGAAAPRCRSRRPKVQMAHVLGADPAPPIDKGLLEGLFKGLDAAQEPSAKAVRQADVEGLWAITPSTARRRSSRADIERALKAAVGRGHDPAAITRGLAAYYASDEATKAGGQYAKGCHRMIENDRWEAFAPPVIVTPDPPADPWRSRVRAFADPANRYWNRQDWGPAPDKPGCAVALGILAEFGFGPGNVIPMNGRAANG